MDAGHYSLWWNWVRSASPQLPGSWIKCSLRLILCFKILHSCSYDSLMLGLLILAQLPTTQSTETCSCSQTGWSGRKFCFSLTKSSLCPSEQRLLKQKEPGRNSFFPPVTFLPWKTDHGKSSFWKAAEERHGKKFQGGKKKKATTLVNI